MNLTGELGFEYIISDCFLKFMNTDDPSPVITIIDSNSFQSSILDFY